MSELDTLKDGITGLSSEIQGALRTPTGAAIGGAVIGGAVIGAVALGVAASKSSSSKRSSKKRKRITHTKRGWKQDRKRFNKRQKWEVAYRKRKAKKSTRGKGRVRHTKNGQPYIILKSGKARFIKKGRRG